MWMWTQNFVNKESSKLCYIILFARLGSGLHICEPTSVTFFTAHTLKQQMIFLKIVYGEHLISVWGNAGKGMCHVLA